MRGCKSAPRRDQAFHRLQCAGDQDRARNQTARQHFILKHEPGTCGDRGNLQYRPYHAGHRADCINAFAGSNHRRQGLVVEVHELADRTSGPAHRTHQAGMSDDAVKGSLGLLCGLVRLRDFSPGNPAARDAHGEQNCRSDQRNHAVPGVQEEENENKCRKKGSIEQRDDSCAGQERPQLAQLRKIVRPAVAAIGGINDRAFKHDGSETLLESDCEATEQPAAQGIERSTENKSDYSDDGEADKGFDAAAADHPIEHFNGIEGQDQKQHVDRHAKGDDPHQRGSSRNQSKQRSLTRRWDFTTVTRIHERPALSLTEYCRRPERGGPAAAPLNWMLDDYDSV